MVTLFLSVSSDGGDVLPGENAQPEGNAQPYDAQLGNYTQ